jgi:ABC-type uncharacterized transport system substrate-binding protein
MLPATAQLTVPADAADSYAFVARLLPTPHDVALIGGSSDNDRALNARIRERLRPLATVRSVTDLTQHTLADLRDRVAALPAGTVIVVGAGQADREGRPLSASILLDTIRPVARGPVVVTNDITIGQGALGGLIYRVEDVGAQAARLVETILQGAPPESPASASIPAACPGGHASSTRSPRAGRLPVRGCWAGCRHSRCRRR